MFIFPQVDISGACWTVMSDPTPKANPIAAAYVCSLFCVLRPPPLSLLMGMRLTMFYRHLTGFMCYITFYEDSSASYR